MEAGTGDKVVRAGMIVSAAHAILKVVGLVAAVIVGRYLDGRDYDAIIAFAFEGIIFSFFLVGEEAIGPCFLPVFMREFKARGEKGAWAFANAVLSVQAIILGAVSLCIMCWPDAIIHAVTKWTVTADVEKYDLARESLVWMTPSLIFLSLASTTYMILNGYKKFFLAALGDATSRVALILSVALGCGFFGFGYRAVIFGLVLGGIGKLGTHLWGLRGQLRLMRLDFNLGSGAIKAFGLMMIPLLAGILFAKFRDIFSNVTALSALQTDGLMKANSLGRKLPEAIVWLVPYALSIAMFPYMCEMLDRNNRKQLGEMITRTTRHLLAIFVPFAFLFCVASFGISEVLFRGGKFTPEMRSWIAISMGAYMFLLPARAVEQVLMQAYFADRRMYAVTVMGILASTLSVAITYVGVMVMGARGTAALAVVAGGLVIGRLVKAAAFAIYMKRKIPVFPAGETFGFLVRVLLVGLTSALFAYFSMSAVDHLHRQASLVLTCIKVAAGGCVGLAVFVIASKALRVSEPQEMLEWALARTRGKLKRGS